MFKELENKVEEALQIAYVKCNGEIIRIKDLDKEVLTSLNKINSLTAKLEHVQMMKLQMQQENAGETLETFAGEKAESPDMVKIPLEQNNLRKMDSMKSI